MAYLNTNQFTARKVLKSKNIMRLDQIDSLLRSSAYYAWNHFDFPPDSGGGPGDFSTPSIRKKFKRDKTLFHPRDDRDDPFKDHSQNLIDNPNDITIVPGNPDPKTTLPIISGLNNTVALRSNKNDSRKEAGDHTSDRCSDSDTTSHRSSIRTIFPTPSVIVKDLYQMFDKKSSETERNSAIINYIQLIFQKMH